MRKRISAKLSLRTRTSTHVLQNCFEVEARLVNMQTLKTIMAELLKERAEALTYTYLDCLLDVKMRGHKMAEI